MVINEKTPLLHTLCISHLPVTQETAGERKDDFKYISSHACAFKLVCLVEKLDVLKLINVTDTVKDRVTSDIFFLVCSRGDLTWW